FEYFRVTRTTTDGSARALAVSRQVCDCQPINFQVLMEGVVLKIPGVRVRLESTTACGESAQHMVVTGLADATSARKNMELLSFRVGDALFNLEYFLSQPDPAAEDEAA